MKATGLTRRVDSLGRVVIPKELRKILRISEGTALEIYTDGEAGIILKKYSPVGQMSNLSKTLSESIAQVCNGLVIIFDRDEVVAAGGKNSKKYEGKGPSKKLEKIMENRQCGFFIEGEKSLVNITDDDECDYKYQVVCSIVSEGDCAGAIVMCGNDEKWFSPEISESIAKTAACFLAKQIGEW